MAPIDALMAVRIALVHNALTIIALVECIVILRFAFRLFVRFALARFALASHLLERIFCALGDSIGAQFLE